MPIFSHPGERTRRLLRYLRRRQRATAARRPGLDLRARPRLFRKQAVVFTDTSDFTVRTARDGILHFLMIFDRALEALAPVVERAGGEVVKVEADSLLLRFPDPVAACRAVEGMERVLRRRNAKLPPDERLRFSYGIGFGDVLDLEADIFGLEVNLASKLGEDMGEPGQVLLTPAAAEGLRPALRRRLVFHREASFQGRPMRVCRLRLRRS